MDWQHLAACGDTDPEAFFPVGDEGPALEQIAAAKAICRNCPVAEPCLNQALTGHHDGIWGGTTEQERRTLHRRATGPITPARLVAATAQAPARVS